MVSFQPVKGQMVEKLETDICTYGSFGFKKKKLHEGVSIGIAGAKVKQNDLPRKEKKYIFI